MATLAFLTMVFVASVTVVSSLLERNEQRTKASEEARNWGQATQGVVTALALTVGGIWTYSVFVHRGSATTHVLVEMEFKRVMNVAGTTRAAVVSVKLKNGGQVPVNKKDCLVGITYFISEEPGPLATSLIGTSLVARSGEWVSIFNSVIDLAPGEVRAEDVLFKVEGPHWFEVGVQFRGTVRGEILPFFPRPVVAGSRMIVDARTAKKRSGDPA